MKLNASTCIIGDKVILVPYKEKHVLKYHEWMQRKDLQEATASDPLTEAEEYEMQKSWLCDNQKCTYIILDKQIMRCCNNEIDAMIGDTNLYLSEDGSDKIAECGIMIAENSVRRQGKGYEAMLLMLKYGCDVLKIKKFTAKIGLANEESISLFKKIKFKMVSKNTVFSEVEFAVNVDDAWKKWLNESINGYIDTYI